VNEFGVFRRRLAAMKTRIEVDFVIEKRTSDFEEDAIDSAEGRESSFRGCMCSLEDVAEEFGRKGAEGRCGRRIGRRKSRATV